MKPIGMKVEQVENKKKPPVEIKPPKLGVIPANLHDVTESVVNDALYTLYTVSAEVIGTEIQVTIIASDLVKHVAGNGVKGYWVGIGIHSSMIENSKVYVGWGSPVDVEFEEPVQPDGEQSVGTELYETYYFDAASAANHEYTAYIVVDRDGVHYHYNIDFSQVEMKESAEILEPMEWSHVSVQKIKKNYLFGIDLSDSQGNPLPEELFVHYMNSAVDYLANLLDITIGETEFTGERHDYFRKDYQNWGFIQLQHNPVREVKGLRLVSDTSTNNQVTPNIEDTAGSTFINSLRQQICWHAGVIFINPCHIIYFPQLRGIIPLTLKTE